MIGALINGPKSCTEIGCECPTGLSGEIECNICSSEEPIFIIGFINVVKVCEGNEIFVCEDGIQKDIRYDLTNCDTRMFFLDNYN